MDENKVPQNPKDVSSKPEDVVSSIDDSALNDTDDLNFQNRLDLTELQQSVQKIKQEIGKVIVGQKRHGRYADCFTFSQRTFAY